MRGHYIIVALILAGCGCREPASKLAISTEFTPWEQEQIISAAEEWCEKAGSCISEARVGEGGPGWTKVELMTDCEERVGAAGDGFVGLCRGTAGPFRGLALHEFGHALFPYVDEKHSSDPMAVMFSRDRLTAPSSLTFGDVYWSQQPYN